MALANQEGPSSGRSRPADAIVVWLDAGDVHAARYDAQTDSWREWAQPIATGLRTGYRPYLTVTPQGDAMFVGPCATGVGGHAPYAVRYDRTLDEWSAAERIDTLTMLPATRGTPVGSDRKGNVMVAYVQPTGNGNTWVTRFGAATETWSARFALEPNASGSLGPTLAVGPNGHALVVWQKESGTMMARVYR